MDWVCCIDCCVKREGLEKAECGLREQYPKQRMRLEARLSYTESGCMVLDRGLKPKTDAGRSPKPCGQSRKESVRTSASAIFLRISESHRPRARPLFSPQWLYFVGVNSQPKLVVYFPPSKMQLNMFCLHVRVLTNELTTVWSKEVLSLFISLLFYIMQVFFRCSSSLRPYMN